MGDGPRDSDANFRVSIRHNMATQHLWTARHLARLCAKREAVVADQDRIDLEHRSFAITAVLSAVCFMEAIVNEIYADAADFPDSWGGARGLKATSKRMLSEVWTGNENIKQKLSVLEKYQFALVCAGQVRMDRGSEPYQSAQKLIDLRNSLVHSKPEWLGWGPGEEDHQLYRKLKGLFPDNQQAIDAPWYPDKCLGAGCAAWACEASTALVDHWWAKMGLKEDYKAAFDRFPAP